MWYLYAKYIWFGHPVTTATNYNYFTWIRVPGFFFFKSTINTEYTQKKPLLFVSLTVNKWHKQTQQS